MNPCLDRAALLRTLEALDELLARAVAAADAAYEVGARHDPHRGLYVGPDEVRRLLGRPPGAAKLFTGHVANDPGWDVVARRFGLDDFDVAALIVALAPEVDLRYERLFGYLNDDVTRRRPTVELVLDLLCGSAVEKLDRRRRFLAPAPLVQHGLVYLAGDPAQPDQPLLARAVRVDEHLVELLLGRVEVDRRLAEFAGLVDTGDEPTTTGVASGRLHFHGPEGVGRKRAALRLVGDHGLIVVDVERALDADPELERVPSLLVTEALLRGAHLYLDHADALVAPDRAAARRRLERAVALFDGLVVLAGTEERSPLPGYTSVAFPLPTVRERGRLWEEELERAGIGAASETVDALASRFRLTRGRVHEAVETATRAAATDGSAPTTVHVFAAARALSGVRLAGLARKVVPRATWDHLVLSADRIEQLREVTNVLRHRGRVYDDWGFDRRLSLGKGVNVLFVGPSGTGKTLAAEIVAGELGLDLLSIDLAAVVSKYIGETEKNLARIFSEAQTANVILFFDEADALFGRRSEVRDSHDRYANLEISYLLQRIETFDGVVVLATNLRKNMDDAFVRRMHFTIEFPLPGEVDRRRIWERIWPAEAPLAPEVDAAELASRFELAGGSIRNIALAAAFLAADDGLVVTRDHVLRATRREYQKLGKVVGEGDFDA